MLTDNDLQKIGRLIDQRLEAQLESKLDKHLRSIKKDIRTLRKDQSIMLKALNLDDMMLLKRVKRIENHLDLSSSD